MNRNDICEIFYSTWHIPLCFFDAAGNMLKLYGELGRRHTALFLSDGRWIMDKERNSKHPVLRYDGSGSCWCFIPLENEFLLLGPVQTGNNPLFPYDNIPEHTPGSFRDIARCLVSLILDKDTKPVEKTPVSSDAYLARQMYLAEENDYELNAYDEIYDCIRHGDPAQLDELIMQGEFTVYLDHIISDLHSAETVFQFCLAKAYHAALDAGVPISDMTSLLSLYLADKQNYVSLNSYKAAIRRILYDFSQRTKQYSRQPYSPAVMRAVTYIQSRIYHPLTTSEVASRCMISISGLQHRFREETGKSVTEYIRECKTERACFFLNNTGLSCADIAVKMGYCSQSYFTAQFRKTKGITPQEYRRLKENPKWKDHPKVSPE